MPAASVTHEDRLMIRPCGNRSRCGPARVGSGLDGLVDGSLQARLVSHDEQEIVRFPAPDLRGSCDVAGSSTLGVGGVAGDHGASSALTSAKLVRKSAAVVDCFDGPAQIVG